MKFLFNPRKYKPRSKFMFICVSINIKISKIGVFLIFKMYNPKSCICKGSEPHS